jgi:FKBP-type peptidyl-prolyl cis-trans isomerase FklB
MNTSFAAFTGLLIVSIVVAAAGVAASAETELKTLRDKSSYSIGLTIGRNLKAQGFNLDIEKLAAGIADGLAGKQQLTDEDIQNTMEAFEKAHTENQIARLKVAAEKNKKEGEAFLAENKTKQGVVTTKSGLQYQILKQGKGEKPGKSDTVTTHYRGTLLDGTEFDSSHKRGEPASFPVDGVIAGWTEALQLMPVGSKWRLFVPAELAYGPQGAGPAIGPNSTLVFEVELLGVGEPKAAPANAEELPEQ